MARVVQDAHLVEADRRTHGARLAHGVAAVEHGHEALGQAVELVEASRQRLVQSVLVLQVKRRARRLDHLASLAGTEAGLFGRAMICDGTITMWVTRERSTSAMMRSASSAGCRMYVSGVMRNAAANSVQ